MTRRRRSRAEAAKPRRARRTRLAVWMLSALGLLGALAVLWWSRSREPRPAPAPVGPWSHLSPLAAFETGVALLGKGENANGLPYLRHSQALTRGQLWEVPHAIFTALMNLSFETRERYGSTITATRSSIERVQLVQEALASLTQAEQVAATPRDLATLRKARADALLIWGFGWEAFVNYRDAQSADSTWDLPGLTADTLMAQLEHPAPSSRADRTVGGSR